MRESSGSGHTSRQATTPDRRNPKGIATRSPDSKRKGTPAAGRSSAFLGPRTEALKLRTAMESSEPDPTDDTSMDAFLEKFQSQPYRGGFREDQWEEVGGPGGFWGRSLVLAAWSPPKPVAGS